MLVESDITLAIEQLEYAKAKYLFSKFLKQTINMLVDQNPWIELKGYHQSVASTIFNILSTGRQRRENNNNNYFDTISMYASDENFPDLLLANKFEIEIPESLSEEWKIIKKLVIALQTFKNNIIEILGTDSLDLDTLIKFNKVINDLNFSFDQHKTLLRHLSDTLFKQIGCHVLSFKNEAHLETYMKEKNDISHELSKCNFFGKINVLTALWKDVKDLSEGGLSPIGTVEKIKNLIKATNSNSFGEFEKQILKLLNFFADGGGTHDSSFSWNYLMTALLGNKENSKMNRLINITNSSSFAEFETEVLNIVNFFPSKFSWKQLWHSLNKSNDESQILLSKEEENSNDIENLKLDRICVFGNIMLEILGKQNQINIQDVASDSLLYSKANAFLDEYFVNRLNKNISAKEKVTEHQLKKVFENFTVYENFFNRVTRLLDITDTNRVEFNIRSTKTMLEKFYEIFKTTNQNAILNELENYKKVMSIFQPINENMVNYFENVDTALGLSGSISTKHLVNNLERLCESFYEVEKYEKCSLSNVSIFLSNAREKFENADRIEKQMTELINENSNLKKEIIPLQDIQQAFNIDSKELLQLVETVLLLKPTKTKNTLFFDKCSNVLRNYDKLQEDNALLKASLEECKKYEHNLEDELLQANESNVKLTYCKQELDELKAQLLPIEAENYLLKEKNQEFEEAIKMASNYNIERNYYVEELENEIKCLKNLKENESFVHY